MNALERRPPSPWWAVRLQLFAQRFISVPVLASALLFALPITVVGIIVAQITGFRLFSRGVVFALLWLAAAPWLLSLACDAVAGFFEDNRDRFLTGDEAWRDLQSRMLADLCSSKYVFMSGPLATVCVWVLLNSLYAASPAPVRIWIAVMFGLLLFLAGMGFWGIARFNHIFAQICQQPMRFDPYHADGFGGLAFLGQFNIKGPQYFFSGALLFPIVLEIVDHLPENELVSLGLWGAVFAFLAFGVASFLIPQLKIKEIIGRRKGECLSESEAVLQGLLHELCLGECRDKDLANTLRVKIDIYYQYFHQRIVAVKEWPFDWNIIMQILSSLIAPLVIVFVETLMR